MSNGTYNKDTDKFSFTTEEVSREDILRYQAAKRIIGSAFSSWTALSKLPLNFIINGVILELSVVQEYIGDSKQRKLLIIKHICSCIEQQLIKEFIK